MGHSDWLPVSRQAPCPKCQKTTWCRTSADGATLICQRVDDGTGVGRENQFGSYWVYRLSDSPRGVWREQPYKKPEGAGMPSPLILNYVYQELLRHLPLSDDHMANLMERGLSEEEISLRGYKSLSRRNCIYIGELLTEKIGVAPVEIAEEIEKIAEEIAVSNSGGLLGLVPGFLREVITEPWQIAGPPGLVIPVRNQFGQVVALKIRLDHATTGSKYIYLSSTRYNGPSPGSPLHVPLTCTSDYHAVRVTEGELKADIATALSGLFTLGLPGVSSWQKAISFLKSKEVQKVIVAFDSDHTTNRNVAYALDQAVQGYSNEGFFVEVEKWQK